MSNEKISKNSEKKFNQEQLREDAVEHTERIREKLEKNSAERGRSSEDINEIKNEAIEQARDTKEKPSSQEKREQLKPPAKKRTGPVPLVEREASYKRTMSDIQDQMHGPSKAFSKFIHTKPVEQASEVLGSTVARPNAILSGAIFAFILTTATFLIARYYGYPLSGFESIGSFAFGWLIGIVYDFLRTMITGKNS